MKRPENPALLPFGSIVAVIKETRCLQLSSKLLKGPVFLLSQKRAHQWKMRPVETLW